MIRRFVLLLVLALLTACSGTPAAEAPAEPAEEPTEEVATTDGAVGDDISGELDIAGSTTVQPLVELLAETYGEQFPNVELNIDAGGSGVGIQAVQNGDVDIGMSSRSVKPEELLEGMETHQIAIDVLAVIVHPTNPVADITTEQLQAIYLGEITNWSELGGNDEPILPVVREVTSGTRGAFDEVALGEAELDESILDVQVTASEVEARVASTPSAIGYVGFGHIFENEINVLQIDGVSPSPETALNNTYLLQRPLLLLTGPLTRDLAFTFVDYALSEEGQQVVAEEGWVPVAGAVGSAPTE